MERVLEPAELMTDDEQARAYAGANFRDSEKNFIHLFGERFPDYDGSDLVLDLGCGPVNITLPFAQRYPKAILHGVDGSAAMLKYGYLALEQADKSFTSRITLIQGFIPGVALPSQQYDVIISKSLLHHLTDPQVLWMTIKQHSKVGTRVLIVDLFRPSSPLMAKQIIETYAGKEPDVLKTDFYNSLLAAFSPTEVEGQLVAAGLPHFTVQTISDRHIAVAGVIN